MKKRKPTSNAPASKPELRIRDLKARQDVRGGMATTPLEPIERGGMGKHGKGK